MRGTVFMLLLVAYIGIQWTLSGRAYRHRVDPARPAWGFDIFFPERYTAEGQEARKLAARFVVIGAAAIAIAMILLSPP
jgi:hypothetical protein